MKQEQILTFFSMEEGKKFTYNMGNFQRASTHIYYNKHTYIHVASMYRRARLCVCVCVGKQLNVSIQNL